MYSLNNEITNLTITSFRKQGVSPYKHPHHKLSFEKKDKNGVVQVNYFLTKKEDFFELLNDDKMFHEVRNEILNQIRAGILNKY
jgi:hypothetical protein